MTDKSELTSAYKSLVNSAVFMLAAGAYTKSGMYLSTLSGIRYEEIPEWWEGTPLDKNPAYTGVFVHDPANSAQMTLTSFREGELSYIVFADISTLYDWKPPTDGESEKTE